MVDLLLMMEMMKHVAFLHRLHFPVSVSYPSFSLANDNVCVFGRKNPKYASYIN